MRKIRVSVIAIGFMFAALSLIFFPPVVQAQDVIKIGALFPVSGYYARMGQDALAGVEVARFLKNEKGGLFGKKIEFVTGDAVDAKAAQTEAEKMITMEKVKLIIGSYATVMAMPASAVAEQNGVIYWETGSVVDKLTQRGFKYLFRCLPTIGKPGYVDIPIRFFADYAPKLGIKVTDLRVAICSENSGAGRQICESTKKFAEQYGMKIVAYELYDQSIKDLGPVILKLKAAKPDALLLQAFINDAILFTRQSKEYDFNVKMFSGVGSGHNMQDFVNAVGNAADGIVTGGWPSFNTNPAYAKGMKEFLDGHQRRYGKPVQSAHTVGSYNGAWILFNDVLPRAGSLDPEAVRKAALATNIPAGGTPIGWGAKFAENGDIVGAQLFMNQWQGGKLYTAWPEAAVYPGVKIILPYPTWADRAKKK